MNSASLYSWQNSCIPVTDNGFSFSLSPSFSAYYGSTSEYVFEDGKRISELKWDIKPFISPGISFCSSYMNFSVRGSYNQALNEKSGVIKDYDWDSEGNWTNYSKHGETQNGSMFMDISAGYSFVINKTISFCPSFGFRYAYLRFTAQNGQLQYPPGSTPIKVYGTGIIYEQKYSIPYVGFSTSALLPWCTVIFTANYSCIGRCDDKDEHIERSIAFYDSIKHINYYNFGFHISRLISEKTNLSIGLNYNYIPLSKGDSYSVDLSSGTRTSTSSNSAGIRLESFDFQTSISIPL